MRTWTIKNSDVNGTGVQESRTVIVSYVIFAIACQPEKLSRV
jgi:hypothetical protein